MNCRNRDESSFIDVREGLHPIHKSGCAEILIGDFLLCLYIDDGNNDDNDCRYFHA